MFKNLTISILLAAVIQTAAFAQKSPAEYSFEQVDSLMKCKPKPVVVFIHTDWCKYCQAMLNTTFKNKEIIRLLNEKFYFIDLNGEEKRDIKFRNKVFRYKPTGTSTGEHELAKALGEIEGKLSFPTTVILNPQYEIVFQYDKMLDVEKMKAILTKAGD